MGNPTQRTEDPGVSAYTYNNLNQLVTGDWSGALSAFGWTQTADLDNVSVDGQSATTFEEGQWTAKGLTVPDGDTTLTVTRTATDQTTTRAQTTVTRPADATAYTYDLNGNMLTDGQWTYTWNDENRMISAEEDPNVGGGSSRRLLFSYDGQGRRRTKSVYTWDTQAEDWTLTREHLFLYDGASSPGGYTAAGWNLIHETITDHTQAPTEESTKSYVWGLDLSQTLQAAGGVGGLLSITRHATLDTHFVAYDGNGNIVALVDSSDAAVAAEYDYAPFGTTAKAIGPAAEDNRWRFSTKYHDAETGLVYYGLRYYKPRLGRWVNRDPAGEDGGVNLYCLLDGAPVCRVGPTGEARYKETTNPDGTTTIKILKPCTIVVLFGHGSDTKPHRFVFADKAKKCSAGGFVGCHGGNTNWRIPWGNKIYGWMYSLETLYAGLAAMNYPEEQRLYYWLELARRGARGKAVGICVDPECCCKEVKIYGEIAGNDWSFSNWAQPSEWKETIKCPRR